MKNDFAIFMPGRLNSERLPGKLLLPVGDTNLWEIACKRLNDLNLPVSKYVLVCDKELIKVAKKFPNLTIIKRDPKTVKIDGPLTEIYKDIKPKKEKYFMFLNPCLPFVSQEAIIKSINTFRMYKLEYASSVKKFQNWIFDVQGKPITPIDEKKLSTKDIHAWEAANLFHIFNKDEFFKTGKMLDLTKLACLAIPREEADDVDTPEDMEYVRFKYEILHRHR